MNRRNLILVIVVILGVMAVLGCSESDDYSDTSVESEAVPTGEAQTTQEEAPAPANTEESETRRQIPVSDGTEESERVTSEEKETPEEEIPEEETNLEEAIVSEESTTTVQISESKKQELIGLVTEYYGADEVSVIFIAPSESSANGLLMVDYYTDATPTQTVLYDDIVNIIIISKSIAEESGITTNPAISVCAMMNDGTPLGIGNYYPTTGQTDVDVSACPW